MRSENRTSEAAPPRREWFATTHWSVVLAARQSDSPRNADALQELCQTYWQPLYNYVRSQGFDWHEAQDLTQEFFARLLCKHDLDSVTPAKGKFRSFLLTALTHFLANQRDRAAAAKRGGGQKLLSLDEKWEEKRQLEQPTTTEPMVFERAWALALLERALTRMRDEFLAAGKERQFAYLKVFLEGDAAPGQYEEIAAKLRIQSVAVAVAVHRFRLRYRALLREEVAKTVTDPAETDLEMSYLLAVLSQ